MRLARGLRHIGIDLRDWSRQASQVAQSGVTSNYLNLTFHTAAARTRRASISKKRPPIKNMSSLSPSEALRLCSNTSDINVIIDLSRYWIDIFKSIIMFDFSGMIVLKCV